MKMLVRSELGMWDAGRLKDAASATDPEINRKYGRRELRIVTESNREQLPNFVEAFRRNEWMTIRPFYQRRPRWDKGRQSKLIESFIMNVPVPPLFVYESDLAKYEVMDGQQRISALLDFYSDQLQLEGLEQWPELNGRFYSTLPSEIRRGIDRRSISYIVLLKESASSTDEEMLLRQQVFERLNTGGIALSNQEIRNSLYKSEFSDALDEIAASPMFRRVWEIPDLSLSPDGKIPEALARNRLFSTMKDSEIVLRFFALRHVEFYRIGMKSFLDNYMLRARDFAHEDVVSLKELYYRTLSVARDIFGELLFRPWDKYARDWAKKPQVAFADAVMIGVAHNLEGSDELIRCRDRVIELTREAFDAAYYGAFTGLRNSKADVQERIIALQNVFKSVL